MQTQILQQRDHIKDIEEKMDVLSSEMYKVSNESLFVNIF